MRAVAAVDDVEHSLAGLAVHLAGEDHVLHGVQDDGAVGLGGRLAVQARSWREEGKGSRLKFVPSQGFQMDNAGQARSLIEEKEENKIKIVHST